MKISNYIQLLLVICLTAGMTTLFMINIQLDQLDPATNPQQLKQTIMLLLLAFLALITAAVFFTYRRIIKPLGKLTELAGQNQNIDLQAQLQVKNGPKEIQQLSEQFISLHQRITSEMEQSLKSHEAENRAQERLQGLLNNVSLSIINIDTDGIINNVNKATHDLFALDHSQLNGSQISDLLPTLNIHGGLFKQILNAGVDIELDAIVGESKKPIELSCTEFNYCINQQNIRQYTLILHDISHRKKNEERLRRLNQRLINTSRQAGIAEIATSILHSVGNVLNSVNTSVSMLQHGLEKGKISGLQKTAQMFAEQGEQLFLTDGKGPQLIEYLNAVADQLEQNKQANLLEIASLKQNVNHIAEIVSAQQKFSGKSGVVQTLSISELLEEALNINVVSLENNQVEIKRQYASPLEIKGDRSKIVQILVNLIRNANEAMIAPGTGNAKIVLSAEIVDHIINICVKDNGHGINKENAAKMFRYGFTTKEDGHGFGLHSCALAAKEMHGSLTFDSEGTDKGTEFKLTLPVDPANREAHDIECLLSAQKNTSEG